MKKTTHFLALLLCSFSLYSQSSIKTIGNINWNTTIAPSINSNDSMDYDIYILNDGNEAIPVWVNEGVEANININVKVSNSSGNPPFSATYDFQNQGHFDMALSYSIESKLIFGDLDTLAVGDTVKVNVTDKATPLYYKKGNNTLVIWPENKGGTATTDSFKVDLEVIYPTNTNFEEDRVFEAYPNPSTGTITIKGNNSLNRFQLFDNSGKLIQTGRLESFIQVQNLSQGLYHIQIIEKNKIHHQQIVVKK